MAETAFGPQANDGDSGTTLGRYTLLAKIGQGGMAEIFLARQAGPRGFERLCALKIMKEMSAGGEEHYDMFLDEARIAAQLSHPNIVQIFDFGEEEERLYIAMEYLSGETLGAVLRRLGRGESFPMALATYVVATAAGALSYAHGCKDVAGRPMNIVHRDISPDNVFITYDGAVKVLDFGIAKASMRSAQTAAGLVKGKIGYMSPEQLQGRELDGRSDVFALGMVLFESLCGQHPFEKKTQPVVEFLTGKSEAPRAKALNPVVPQELDDIIANAIERDRDDRIFSAAELQRMLEAWLKTQEGVTSAALSAWMQEHFKGRLADRKKLLEQALSAPAPGAASRAAAEASSASTARPMTPPTLASDTRPGIDLPPLAMEPVAAPLGGGTGEMRAPGREVTSPTIDSSAPLIDSEPVQEPATVQPGQSSSTVIAKMPEPPGGDDKTLGDGQSSRTVRARPLERPGQSESTVRAESPPGSTVVATMPQPPPGTEADGEVRTENRELAAAAAQAAPDAAKVALAESLIAPPEPTQLASRLPERSLTEAEVRQATGKPRGAIFAAAGIVLLVVAGGAYLLLRGAEEPKPTTPVAQQKTPAKPPEAAPAVGKVSLTTVPEHASVSVDGQDRGAAPLQLELPPGKHTVAAHADGFEDATKDLELKAGDALPVELALVPKPKETGTTMEGMDFSNVDKTDDKEPKPAREKKEKHVAKGGGSSKSAAKEPGKLTLDTVPWSTVYEGQQKLGDTPLFQVQLAAGNHTLRLVNGPAHLEKSVSVSIKPGKVTEKRVNLK